MDVFLIGMMGSGKTTTARELAKLTGFQAKDLDALIVERAGKTINEIFSEDGEAAFRELEKEVLKDTVASNQKTGSIFGTSGGIVLAHENIRLMRDNGALVYLKTSFPVLWERVKNSKDRPLLRAGDPQAALRAIFMERTPLYESAAGHSVVTDYKTPREVAREIYEKFLK